MVDRIHRHDSYGETAAYRLFGREKPVQKLFGGGKPADVFLWMDKKVSAAVLSGVTAIWVLFDVLEYHMLTLVSHGLIIALAVSFLWSNATTFVTKYPPSIPKIDIPEDPVLKLASALRIEINEAIAFLRDIALGKDLMFLCCAAVHCARFYEKYEHRVDSFAEKAMAELKKQFAVFDAKVLSKIPRGPLKDKKRLEAVIVYALFSVVPMSLPLGFHENVDNTYSWSRIVWCLWVSSRIISSSPG